MQDGFNIIGNVPHGPEIMYFKEGQTGYMVSEADTNSLAEKLQLLLIDNELRRRIGEKAREEIMISEHVERPAQGFLECLESLEEERKNWDRV